MEAVAGMKNDSISLKAIAKELGLSPGTISIVLNHRGDEMRISQATQQKILEYTKSVNYQPNIYAKRLRKSLKNKSVPLIVVFWPTNFNPNLLSRFFIGVNSYLECSAQRIEIMVQPYRTNEISKFVDNVQRDYCSGAIIMGLSEKDVDYLAEKNFDLPIVLFNRVSDKYSTVCVDDFDSGCRTAELFLKRGHRHMAIIGYGLSSRPAVLKRSGFICALAGKGILMDENDVIDGELSYQGGANTAERLIEKHHGPMPTALFFQDGVMAIGALTVFQKHGIRVPEDMEILSYGDNPQEAYTIPTLTSVHMPVEEMSYDCIKILLDIIVSGSPQHHTTMHPISFIFRESCGSADTLFEKKEIYYSQIR
jgi:DNA-binding LacI/PurR family transcriptional regulator